MTGMLASVNSKDEALQILNYKVDIIDLKQPAQGALGALEIETVSEIVNAINGLYPVSATVGDLVMQPDLVFNAVEKMAATGVDYVKIGLFPEGDTLATLERLAVLTEQGRALIAVLFADQQPDLSVLATLKQVGFKGVMLDTMNKQRGSLMQVMEFSQIEKFVSLAKQNQLLCGLAGSLRLADIQPLLALSPDYLGFRGALCKQHNRVAELDAEAISKVRHAIRSEA
ncbi:MAG: hypothetical protein GQ569_15320 [Methylococcaceae bacterium]|nr:hypothetical protein [Methylococcaceae bacterium]